MKYLKQLFLLYSKSIFTFNRIIKRNLLNNSYKNNYFYKTTIKNNNVNNLILDGKCKVYHSKIDIRGKNNKIQLKQGVNLRNTSILIKGDNNHLIIGKYCQFNKLNVIMEKNGNSLIIGNNTTNSGIVELYIKEKTNIRIGNDCMLSRSIIMRTSDGHSIMQSNKRINPSKDIIIGDKCWISQNVTLLKGVTLPENTIVGVGSIVTKSFTDENTILGGIPARVLKTDISWDRELI